MSKEKTEKQNRQIVETVAAQVQMLTERHILDINTVSASNFDKVTLGYTAVIDRSVKPHVIKVKFKIAPIAVKDSDECELEDDTQPTLGLDGVKEQPKVESADECNPKKKKGAQPA